MDVAIVGAGGTVGRQIAVALVQQGRLPRGSRLQLVGRRGGASANLLPGFAADLRDAFGADCPQLHVVDAIEAVCADLVVCAAGATITGDGLEQRSDLATSNRPIVAACAAALARHGHGGELLLVLSNPVEDGVATACNHLPRHRVIGLGGLLDTLRFRREIAEELGVDRERIEGLVLGEHGPGMVPCWSTVALSGPPDPAIAARLTGLRRDPWPPPASELAGLRETARQHGSAAALRRVDRLDAAARTLLRPFVTQLSGARTPLGTAAMVATVVGTIASGGRLALAAQILLDGECGGLRGVVGAPLILGPSGVESVEQLPADPRERAAVIAALRPGPTAQVANEPPGQAQTWTAVLHVHASSRPGTLTRLGRIFGDRGINLERLSAEVVDGRALVVGVFSAGPRLAAWLARRLSAEPEVQAVDLQPGQAPTAPRPRDQGGGWA